MIDVENNFNPNIHTHKKRHRSFMVEVSHVINELSHPWNSNTPIEEHKLCLYCYIFDNHPLFEQLAFMKPYGYSYAQDVIGFNFHGGVTFALPILSHTLTGELKLGSIKVGCDYNHYGDEFYPEEHNFPANLRSVCNDAQRLYEYLEQLFVQAEAEKAKKEDPYIGTDTTAVLAIPLIEEKDINNEAS